jgi:hypothetical protein
MSSASDPHVWRPVGNRRHRRRLQLLHIGVSAFTALGDETVDPRRDNGQRYRAELEHRIVERADVELRSERFLRFFAGARDRELAHIISAKADGVWAGFQPSILRGEEPGLLTRIAAMEGVSLCT